MAGQMLDVRPQRPSIRGTFRPVWLLVAAVAGFGAAGCGDGDAAASVTPGSFSVALPAVAPLSRDDITELKTKLSKRDAVPVLLPVAASVFDFDSAEPNRDDAQWVQLMELLAGARDTAVEHGWRIVVEGYTDTTGSSAYNLSLSERRAAAVRERIVADAGYPAGSVTSVGRGEGGSAPADRRVIVHFIPKGQEGL